MAFSELRYSEADEHLQDSHTLPRQIQDRIIEYIEENGLEPGDRLPTESELCTLFGVSRTPLRESIKYLEVLGIVSVERSRGTFVRGFDAAELLTRLPMKLFYQRDEFLQMLKIRMVLEEHCLVQAIGQSSEADIDKLENALEVMRLCADQGRSMLEEDLAFHKVLAELSRSGRLMTSFLQVLWDLRLRLPTDERPEALQERYERHLRLYRAVRERDVQMARVYLIEHFRGAYDDMIQGLDHPAHSNAIHPERT